MEREISIRVPAFDAFITEYSANISATGMFIRSDKPLPPDTQISLEFKIADDWKLIRGKAKVVWSRYRNEGPDQPSGMGVLFTELEPQSRRLIHWIIEKHVRDGGKPFDLGHLSEPTDLDDLGEPAATGGDSSADLAQARPAARPSARARRSDRPPTSRGEPPTAAPPTKPVRFRLGSLILAGLAVALVLAGLFWLSERGAQSAASPDLPPEEAAADAGDRPADPSPAESGPPSAPRPGELEAEPAASVPTEASAAAPPSTADAPASQDAGAPPVVSPVFYEGVRRLVEGWSRAWSEQDVEAYLAHYSRNFRPPSGESRSAWAAGRQERLRAPEFIEISVSELEAEVVSESQGRAIFEQGYRSDTYQDSVRKVLELVREDGRWKILEEKTAG